MKNNNIYNALSEINEKYLERSEDFKGISAEFKRAKIRRIERIGSIAACLVLVTVVSLNVYDKNNMIQRESFINSQQSETENIITEPDSQQSFVTTTAESEEILSVTNTENSTEEHTQETDYVQTQPAVTGNTSVSSKSSVTTVKKTSVSRFSTIKKSTLKSTGATTVRTSKKSTAKNTTVTTVKTTQGSPVVCNTTVTTVKTSVSTGSATSKTTGNSMPVSVSMSVTVSISRSDWDEKSIYNKFNSFVYGGISYGTNGTEIGADKVGDKLASITVSGYDEENDKKHYINADIFLINGFAQNDQVALRFEGRNEYYIYLN